MYQPWHRDFPAPPETLVGGRLNSLAFNLTGVDTTEDMGPFEIAPGTQWDDRAGLRPRDVPAAVAVRRATRRGRQRKLPQMGDISARSALTIHRGTAEPRTSRGPVLVLGVDAPGPATPSSTT